MKLLLSSAGKECNCFLPACAARDDRFNHVAEECHSSTLTLPKRPSLKGCLRILKPKLWKNLSNILKDTESLLLSSARKECNCFLPACAARDDRFNHVAEECHSSTLTLPKRPSLKGSLRILKPKLWKNLSNMLKDTEFWQEAIVSIMWPRNFTALH